MYIAYLHVYVLAYRTTSCMDPMELYQPEVNEEDESTQDVTAPEVEFMGTEEVFSVLPEITKAMMSPRKRRLEVKETLKQTRNIETLSLSISLSLSFNSNFPVKKMILLLQNRNW